MLYSRFGVDEEQMIKKYVTLQQQFYIEQYDQTLA